MLKKNVSNSELILCLWGSPEGGGRSCTRNVSHYDFYCFSYVRRRKKSVTLMRVCVIHYNYVLRFEVSIAMKWYIVAFGVGVYMYICMYVCMYIRIMYVCT